MNHRLPVSLLGLVLLCPSSRSLAAQAGVTRPQPAPIRAWGFVRLGFAASAPVSVATSGGDVLMSGSAGVAASDGVLLAMVKLSDAAQFMFGPEIRDWSVLAGLRTRGDRAFVTGAAGVARATPFFNGDQGGGGAVGSQQTALAYDLSAHFDYKVAGLSVSVAGIAGPPKRSYVAALLGVEAGWFGE